LDGFTVGNTGAFVGLAVVGLGEADGEAVVGFDVVGETVGIDEVGLDVGYEDGNPVVDCAEAI
jgi:hypothetical protein